MACKRKDTALFFKLKLTGPGACAYPEGNRPDECETATTNCGDKGHLMWVMGHSPHQNFE